ncbi:STAS domain-containing protein [Streptomyces sp. NPDC051133]|uniref:STAS domain-containing protein n=1 Tax=Streptomyces sp. NPDC051133 TaxID=3155521 RepID=UPI0034399E55
MKQESARAKRAVVLDLTDVSSCDSAGLNVLPGAHRDADRAGVEPALAGVPVC